MDKDAIYQKTEKGNHEVATRGHRLPARERSMLILVDGKRSAGTIIAQAMHFGDAEQFFAHLVEEGFIEAVGSTAATAPAPPAARSAPVAAPLAASATPPIGAPVTGAGIDRMAAFMSAKAFATRYFIDMLGPEADPLTMKIESAKTEGQLILIMEKCRDIIQQTKGRDRAERFWQRIQDTLASGS